MAAAIKMDELLVSWLTSDAVYEDIIDSLETYQQKQQHQAAAAAAAAASAAATIATTNTNEITTVSTDASPRGVMIPPFYEKKTRRRRRLKCPPPRPKPRRRDNDESAGGGGGGGDNNEEIMGISKDDDDDEHANIHVDDIFVQPWDGSGNDDDGHTNSSPKDQTLALFGDKQEAIGLDATFGRFTKDICQFPSFFNAVVYQRVLDVWNMTQDSNDSVVTLDKIALFWRTHMEPFDVCDRFFHVIKQHGPEVEFIVRDDFLPLIKALLADHPGLEFLASHAEFQEKYAVTVITRIFYGVNKGHSGRISSRQVRRSDLIETFWQVDDEEDINKVTRYFSYEHFYVLYCRFWELDHDRDYKITREDLLRYSDHSLSHMIVDRIFDAAPRPFSEKANAEYLSYEDFIFFMLSEEDKSNEVSVRYWFTCVDVDGDGKLNNMEMRSFYAVQLHRMQCMGNEIVPFEDCLCQFVDLIKPQNEEYFVPEDFMKPECKQVSGALFDALFNLNKYLLFEQRDPFVERQKREDEFECDWDRFACIDYNRLAMEEEAREEEAMSIDWVSVDEDDDDDERRGQMNGAGGGGGGGGTSSGGATAAGSEAGGEFGAAAAPGASEAPF